MAQEGWWPGVLPLTPPAPPGFSFSVRPSLTAHGQPTIPPPQTVLTPAYACVPLDVPALRKARGTIPWTVSHSPQTPAKGTVSGKATGLLLFLQWGDALSLPSLCPSVAPEWVRLCPRPTRSPFGLCLLLLLRAPGLGDEADYGRTFLPTRSL